MVLFCTMHAVQVKKDASPAVESIKAGAEVIEGIETVEISAVLPTTGFHGAVDTCGGHPNACDPPLQPR